MVIFFAEEQSSVIVAGGTLKVAIQELGVGLIIGLVPLSEQVIVGPILSTI